MKVAFFKVAPMGKPRMTRADAWRKRKCVQDYYAFKDQLVIEAKKIDFQIKPNMEYLFVVKMPDSWPEKKKQNMLGKPCCSKPDLDNMIKAVWDALCDDDKAIHSIASASKMWGIDGCIIIKQIKESKCAKV